MTRQLHLRLGGDFFLLGRVDPGAVRDAGRGEGAWANMKNGLGNLAARNAGRLAAVVRSRLKRIQYSARPHRRVPYPDRTHHRARTAVAT
ncbi:MAG TPA: hypothetical protein VMV07_23580 [Streptosporangiaceae bacterium]|nr:hypothetical protein [Streptosporangiaceae bacterium]